MTEQAIDTSKYKPKQSTEAILALAMETQASPSEIADVLNVSNQAVYQCLERHKINPNRLKSYKNHRADIFAGIQTKIIKHIDERRLEKASAFQLVGSLGLLYDKERVERGLATEIVSYRAVSLEVSKIDVEIRRLEQELSRLPSAAPIEQDEAGNGRSDSVSDCND
jgi:predicted DNA-binding protein YlxM (UPF0122 family)